MGPRGYRKGCDLVINAVEFGPWVWSWEKSLASLCYIYNEQHPRGQTKAKMGQGDQEDMELRSQFSSAGQDWKDGRESGENLASSSQILWSLKMDDWPHSLQFIRNGWTQESSEVGFHPGTAVLSTGIFWTFTMVTKNNLKGSREGLNSSDSGHTLGDFTFSHILQDSLPCAIKNTSISSCYSKH